MKYNSVSRAIDELLAECEHLSPEELIAILVNQGFDLQEIADTMNQVDHQDSSPWEGRVFSRQEQAAFPISVQETLLCLGRSGLFTGEEMELVVTELLSAEPGPGSSMAVLEAFGEFSREPFTKGLLTPGLISH